MAGDIDPEYQEFLKTLGSRIRQLRHERGFSLRDMVIQHGYNDSQWRRYERGGSMNLQSVLKIAKTFGVSLSKFLDGLGEFPEVSVTDIQKKRAAKQVNSKSKKPSK